MSEQSEKPIEILLFDFLSESIEAALPGSALYELELHDTIYQNIKKGTNDGLRIGEADSDFAPLAGNLMKEFDAQLTLVCFARVVGKDKTERQDALHRAFEIHKAVAALLYGSPGLGGRVCDDTLILRASRGYDSINGEPFAVVNQPLVFSPSGKYNFDKLS